MAPGSTLAAVLRIDELMQLVWSFLENPDLASLACVSRELSPCALAALYSDLASVRPLFHLITRDMYRWEDFGEPGSHPPEIIEQWSRFDNYARLVRHLTVDTALAPRCLPETSAWDDTDAFVERVFAPMASNLVSLIWMVSEVESILSTTVPRLSVFESLRRLTLGASHRNQLCFWYKEISWSCRQLTYIEIRLTDSDTPGLSNQIAEDELLDMLGDLQELRTVILPGYWVTTAVLQTLSSLPYLEQVTGWRTDSSGAGSPYDVSNLRFPRFTETHAFAHLSTLQLTAQLDHVKQLMSTANAPRKIEVLGVQSPLELETSDNIRSFLGFVSHILPKLRDLALELRIATVHPSEFDLNDRLHSRDFTPLTLMLELRAFAIMHSLPLAMTDRELDELLTKLPRLETLHLNPEPLPTEYMPQNVDVPSLSLGSLSVVARRCPKLVDFGIFLHSLAELNEPMGPEVVAIPSALEVFHVGTSKANMFIDGTARIAARLLNLLPSSCEIQWGAFWPDREETEDVNWEELDEWGTTWSEVADILDAARASTLRETCDLRQEVERLQRQNAALTRRVESLQRENDEKQHSQACEG